MMQYLILCPSLTGAQKMQRIFERAGLTSTLVKAPQRLSVNGCGYALRLYRKIDRALELIEKNKLMHGKIYRIEDNGTYEFLGG